MSNLPRMKSESDNSRDWDDQFEPLDLWDDFDDDDLDSFPNTKSTTADRTSDSVEGVDLFTVHHTIAAQLPLIQNRQDDELLKATLIRYFTLSDSVTRSAERMLKRITETRLLQVYDMTDITYNEGTPWLLAYDLSDAPVRWVDLLSLFCDSVERFVDATCKLYTKVSPLDVKLATVASLFYYANELLSVRYVFNNMDIFTVFSAVVTDYAKKYKVSSITDSSAWDTLVSMLYYRYSCKDAIAVYRTWYAKRWGITERKTVIPIVDFKEQQEQQNAVSQEKLYASSQLVPFYTNAVDIFLKDRMSKSAITGVYVIFNKTKDLIYVGQAKNLWDRAAQHFGIGGNSRIFMDYQQGHNFEISLYRFGTSCCDTLDEMEHKLIKHYNAVDHGYNTAG